VTELFSVVVPVHDEGASVVACLDRLTREITSRCEIHVVYDTLEDSTRPYVESYAAHDPRVVPTLNTYGRGPANAIRFGIDAARGDVVVVTMADGSDDPTQVEQLVRLVREGAVIAAASRYMRGGRQLGAPRGKSALSRLAGLSLFVLARAGIHDATSSYKAYDRAFVNRVGIESTAGFEIAIELVAKARRRRLPVAEIPTTWHERTTGTSNFKVLRWLPYYLRWYVHAFGPRVRDAHARA
jgi:glycosyltransferase involved in cell wall biosynthesis